MRALRLAARLRDFKNDDPAAAKVLDAGLAHAEPTVPLERARALVARIELALALGDPSRAPALRAELEALPLTDPERTELQPELEQRLGAARPEHVDMLPRATFPWNAPYYRRLEFEDLPDATLGAALRQIRAQHIARGLDETRRVFMRRPVAARRP